MYVIKMLIFFCIVYGIMYFFLVLWMKLVEKLGKNKYMRFYELNIMY